MVTLEEVTELVKIYKPLVEGTFNIEIEPIKVALLNSKENYEQFAKEIHAGSLPRIMKYSLLGLNAFQCLIRDRTPAMTTSIGKIEVDLTKEISRDYAEISVVHELSHRIKDKVTEPLLNGFISRRQRYVSEGFCEFVALDYFKNYQRDLSKALDAYRLRRFFGSNLDEYTVGYRYFRAIASPNDRPEDILDVLKWNRSYKEIEVLSRFAPALS